MLKLPALFLLGADVQQTYAGLLYPHGFLHENASQYGELLEHFRTALKVCAAVDYRVSSAAEAGHERNKRSPLDALYALADHSAADYDSRSASRADERVGIAFSEVIQRLAH